MIAFIYYNPSVYYNCFDSLWILFGLCPDGAVHDGVGIKQGQIGKISLPDLTSPVQIEFPGGQRGHFLNGPGQGEDFFLTGIPAQHPGKGPVQAGMGIALVQDSIGCR